MLKSGWNTWNVRSVLSHVLLPDSVSISLGIKSYATGQTLREALIGRKGRGDEIIVPGPRSYDGAYTSLVLTWQDVKVQVETAVHAGDWFALVAKSEALLLKEWREHGHVHENYNADTGEGCGIGNSDAFYHWGGLLGLISVLEHQTQDRA